jgi:hypothetical protein
MHGYLIPTLRDMPVIETIFVEDQAEIGPYGAKGIGEPSLIPTAASILNAIHHATGALVISVPATPEVTLNALHSERARTNFAKDRSSTQNQVISNGRARTPSACAEEREMPRAPRD